MVINKRKYRTYGTKLVSNGKTSEDGKSFANESNDVL